MKNISSKLISIVLALCIVLQTSSVALASVATSLDDNDSSLCLETDNDCLIDPKEIILEDTTKRNTNSKTFLTNEGLFMYADYNEPIHKLVDEEYIEIDNTIIVEQGNYKLTDPNYEVSFPLILDGSSTFYTTNETNKYTLRWNYSGVNSSEGTVILDEEDSYEGNDRFLILNNKTSKLNYTDIYNNVDLNYIFTPSVIKENIVLNAVDSQRTFVITYYISDLEVLLEDKTIYLKSEEDTVFEIDFPYMTDSSFNTSDGIEITILEKTDDTLTVKLALDDRFLDEADYPVTIDPVVRTVRNNPTIDDTFIASGTPNTRYYGYGSMTVGKEATYKTSRMMVKINLPELGKTDTIVDATLTMYQTTNSMSPTGSTMRVDVHEIPNIWDIHNATWNTDSNNISDKILDFDMAGSYSSPHRNTFNITSLVKRWYKTETNNGIVLRWSQDEGTTYRRCVFFSSNNSSTPQYFPCITILYYNQAGLENYLSYHSQQVNSKTVSYVNDYTGNLVVGSSLLSTTGERVPTSISIYYNGMNSDESIVSGISFGKGYTSNITQRIDVIPSTSSLYPTYRYIYIDPDATEHYLYQSGTKYLDEEGLCLELTVSDNEYTLTYKDGSKKVFNSSGQITSVIDSNLNSSSYSYSNGILTSITDGVGRVTNLEVDEQNRVTRISYDNKYTVLTYDSNGRLVRIDYPDTDYTRFYYNNNDNRIVRILSKSDNGINYYYNDESDYQYERYRIDKVEEFYIDDEEEISGGYVSFNYLDDNTTKITYLINSNEIEELNSFDNLGRVKSSVNLSDYSSTDYTYTSVSGGGKNKITDITAKGGSIHNLILDSSFELNTNWSYINSSRVNSQSYLGKYSVRLNDNSTLTQTLQIESGTYALSFYAKGEGSVEVGEEVFDLTDDWERYVVTLLDPDEIVFESNGTNYIDCVQLELGDTANHYNLLNQTTFDSLTLWDTTYLGSNDGITEDNLVVINALRTTDKNIRQVVNIGRPASEVVLIGSAKCIVDSVPKKNDRMISMEVRIYYTDNTSELIKSEFNYDTRSLQYHSFVFMPSQANINKTVDKVRYMLCVEKSIGEVYFTEPQLFLDESGTSYTYDSNGNIVSSKQHSQSTKTLSYNDVDEVTSAEFNNESYYYTYDPVNRHRIESARSNQTDIGLHLGYNSSGSITEVRLGTINEDGTLDDSEKYILISESYSENGNYLTQVTDQVGNIVTYDVDEYSGKTNSITDGRNVTTYYTYNNREELTEVSSSNSSVSYSYDQDTFLITSITESSTVYNFTYDRFGNLLSTDISGEYTLSENEYLDNNGSLNRITLGNGYETTYSYDELSRVVSVTDGDDSYYYSYDARGNVSKIRKGNDVVVEYFYDQLDRVIKYRTDDLIIKYFYDDVDRTTRVVYEISDISYEIVNSYGADNRLESTLTKLGEITYNYDSLNRLTQSSISDLISYSYDYLDLASNRTATLVDGLEVSINDNVVDSYSYTYDENSNITRIVEDGQTTTYTYDSLNRLTSSRTQDEYIVYCYDDNSNIVEKRIYEVDGRLVDLDSYESILYEYQDENWSDLLTCYDGEAITYDEIGNPISYRDSMVFSWEGRRLATVTKPGSTISYSYNIDGIRTSKTVNGVETTYTLSGTKVVKETRQNNTIYYYYDSNSDVIGLSYGGNDYYYVKDLQGDVVKIVDESGNIVVNYSYNEWGKVEYITGRLSTTLGQANPFRYRSYYYDNETGLYYLNARYYDPETCRFISADDVDVLTLQMDSLKEKNIFVYCNNNPIFALDPLGLFNLPGVLVGCGLIFLASIMAAYLPQEKHIIIAESAIAATGATVIYSAASDSVMVADISYSKQLPGTYIKSGVSVLIDFSSEGGVYSYEHAGTGIGKNSGASYLCGSVFGYDGPDSYSGKFYDASFGSMGGIDFCVSPPDCDGNTVCAFSVSFSTSDFFIGGGIDHYSNPRKILKWGDFIR